MNDTTALIRRHVEAVTKMILVNAKLMPGLAILAGETLDRDALTWLAEAAVQSCTDVIHLEFSSDADGELAMSGINICAPREGRCYVYSRCRLAIPEGAKRALIIPRNEVRGHFVIDRGDIVHVDGKPRNSEAAVRRAHERLSGLLRTGANVNSQIHITEMA